MDRGVVCVYSHSGQSTLVASLETPEFIHGALSYNEWQTVHHFDRYQKEIVKARSLALKRWAEEQGSRDFSDWQIEMLDEIVDSLDSLDSH